MWRLTQQGGGVAEVEVQGNATLLRGQGAFPLQVRLACLIPRKAQRLGHNVPLTVSAPQLRLRLCPRPGSGSVSSDSGSDSAPDARTSPAGLTLKASLRSG